MTVCMCNSIITCMVTAPRDGTFREALQLAQQSPTIPRSVANHCVADHFSHFSEVHFKGI